MKTEVVRAKTDWRTTPDIIKMSCSGRTRENVRLLGLGTLMFTTLRAIRNAMTTRFSGGLNLLQYEVKKMLLHTSIEKIVRWENRPIRALSWNGSQYQVEVGSDLSILNGTYEIELFESGYCTKHWYDPKSDQILIGKNKPRIVPFITKKFPPQFESKLKKEVRFQIASWNAYLKAKRKIICAELKQVYQLMSVSSSLEEDRLLADEGVRLIYELDEVS